MTTWYLGVCLCGQKLEIPQGGGWTFIQMVCDACGSFRDFPRYLQRDAPEMDEAAILSMLAEGRHKWPRGGRSPTDREAAILDRLTRPCPCTGRFVKEYENGAAYRCPACKSERFEWIDAIGPVSD